MNRAPGRLSLAVVVLAVLVPARADGRGRISALTGDRQTAPLTLGNQRAGTA